MSDNINVGVTIRAQGSGQVTAEMNRVRDGISGAGTAAQNTNREFANMARVTTGLSSALSAVGITLGAVGLVAFSRDVIRTIETLQNLDIRLQGLTKNAKDYAATQDYLSTTARNHHKDVIQLSEAYSKLLTIEQTGVISRTQTKALLEGISNAQSKTGATAQQLSQSMVGLSQALSMGTLQWEEMKQVTEPIPGLMLKIAEAAGYTGESAIGDFKALVEQGAITSEMFGRIMVEALGQYQGAAEKAGETLTATYADVANSWTELVRIIEQPVADVISPILRGISSTINSVTRDAKELGVALSFVFMQKWNTGTLAAADAQMNAIKKKYSESKNTGGASGDWSDGKTGSWEQDGPTKIRAQIEAAAETKKLAEQQEKQAKIVEKLTNANKKLTLSSHEFNKQELEAQGFKGDALKKVLALADANEKLSSSHGKAGGAAKAHTGAARSHVAAISDTQRAQEATTRAINQAMAALDDQHKKLTLSERDYFAQSDVLTKMSEKQKIATMAKWDMVQADEAKQKSDKEQKKSVEDQTKLMDDLIDKYKQLTLSAREFYQQVTLPKTGLTTQEQQKPYLAQFDKTETATADAKKISASKAALDSYISSLDTANKKTADLSAITTSLGDVTSSVFDGALGGVNLLVGAFSNMVTAIDASTAKIQENNAMQVLNNNLKNSPEKIATGKKLAKEEQKLNNDLVLSKITGVRQIAAATSAMLKQGSTEQKIAHTIEMGLFGAELAMNILRIAGIEAVTIAHLFGSQKKIAQNTVEAGSNAVVAISSQAGAGPYIGFVLMAAMAAAMAAIGAMSGGSSAAVAAPNPYQSPTTGTVLGDASAQSESINKTYELLQDIHAEEYAELRSINEGVWKLSSGITNVITKALQTGYLTGTTYGPHLGESKYKVSGGGMAIAEISFGELLSGVFELQGQMFLTESKLLSKKGKPAKYKYTDYFSEMTDETTKALTDVFMAIAQTMSGVGKELGKIIGTDFSDQLKSYIIPALKIDLRELTGKEAVEKVNGVISTAMDQMATAVFGDIVGQYQQLGEGMLETAIRVVAQFVVVKDALNQAGISMADDALALSDALVKAAGGLKEFQTQFENYYDKFYTEQEKTERLYQRLVSQLSDVNLILPTTREEYRKLFEVLDLNNELDVERYTLLLKLATAADTYYTAITDATAATEEATKAQKEYYESLGESANAAVVSAKAAYDNDMKPTVTAVREALDLLIKAYEDQIKQIETTIAKLTDFIDKMKKFRDSLVLSNLSTSTPAKKYADSRAQLMDTYKIIQSGPGTTDASKAAYDLALKDIEEKSKTFLENSRVYNASGSQYTTDYNLILDIIKKTSASAKVQLTDAQKQLAATNKTNDLLNQINKSVLSTKDLKGLTTLINSINSPLTASIKAAIDKFNLAMKAQEAASKVATAKYLAAVKAQAEMSKAIASNRAAGTDLAAKKTAVTDKQAAVKAAQITYEAAKTKDKQQAAAILKWQEDANRAVYENKFYYDRAKGSGNTAEMESLAGMLPNLQRNADAANARAATITASSETLNAKAALDARQKELVNAQTALTTSQNYYNATTKLIDYLESVRTLTALKDELTQYSINALGRQLTATEKTWIEQLSKKPSVYDGYAAIDTYAITHGSHAKGLDFVPFDGYKAELHKGERILTASQSNDNGVISQEIIAELQMLRKEVEQLRSEQKNQTGALIQSNYDANDRASDKVIAGSKDASKDLIWAAKNKAVII